MLVLLTRKVDEIPIKMASIVPVALEKNMFVNVDGRATESQ